jgi:hypothetical protein
MHLPLLAGLALCWMLRPPPHNAAASRHTVLPTEATTCILLPAARSLHFALAAAGYSLRVAVK